MRLTERIRIEVDEFQRHGEACLKERSVMRNEDDVERSASAGSRSSGASEKS